VGRVGLLAQPPDVQRGLVEDLVHLELDALRIAVVE
jgi:hypothetical protein